MTTDDEPPFWTTTGSRKIITDRWIRLRADDCVTAAGQTIAPYYVLEYPDWVHVVALTNNDEIVLVEQYRHAVRSMVLELPGGATDAVDTTIEAAARRELMEETGYTATTLLPVYSLFPNPATHTNRLHIFVTQDATRVASPRLDAGEDSLSVRLMPLSEVLPKLKDGILGQAMHVSALLLGLAAIGRLDLGGD